MVALDFCDIVGTAQHSLTSGTDNNNNVYNRQWLRNVFTDPTTGVLEQEEECISPEQTEEPWVAEGAVCVSFDDAAAAPPSDSGRVSGGGTSIAVATIVAHVLVALVSL